jgi:RNA polymerase sigma factor (sigma-70 family)
LHDPSAAGFVERASDVRLASATKSSPAATKGTGLANDHVGVLRADPLPELELLYRRELSRYVRVARAIVGDEQTALDAVQEAFTRAIEKRRSFRRRGPLEAWVWRIVVNEARKRAAAGTRRATAADEALASGNGRPDADADLRAAVAALPERQRLAVFLRYYADLDYAAIATALGIETGTVAATLNAAHRKLQSTLKEPTA